MMKFLASLFCTVMTITQAQAVESRPPNVLVMIVDDLGVADLGAQGATDVATPQIDSIARDGARFTNAYVSAPVCSPSRAGLMTGRYQTRFGHEFNHPMADRGPVGLPLEETLWPVYFKQAGYKTYHIGKWHLGNPQTEQFHALARGFDHSFHFPGAKKLPPENKRASAGNLPAFPYLRDKQPATVPEDYVDAGMANVASEVIRQAGDQPWFIYLAFLTPHEPVDLPPGADAEFASIEPEKRRKFVSAMSQVDRAVGRVLQALKEANAAEDTLVFFLSDNGAPPGNGSTNYPYLGTKGTTWEGGLRVPLYIRWTGKIPAGQTFAQPVISLDLLPTALDAAHLKASTPLDGVSLLPLLTGKSQKAPHEALYWRFGDQWAIREGDWKFVRAGKPATNGRVPSTPEEGALYQLSNDPTETRDLSADFPEVRARLKEKWDSWNSQQVAPLWLPDGTVHQQLPSAKTPAQN